MSMTTRDLLKDRPDMARRIADDRRDRPARCAASVVRGGPLILISPMRTVSEANRRGGWYAHDARRKAQRMEIALLMKCPDARAWLKDSRPPYRVNLARIGKRMLDDDNLASSFKAIRDQIAEELGVDDGDTRSSRWAYEQRRDKTFGVEVTIQAAPAGAGVAGGQPMTVLAELVRRNNCRYGLVGCIVSFAGRKWRVTGSAWNKEERLELWLDTVEPFESATGRVGHVDAGECELITKWPRVCC